MRINELNKLNTIEILYTNTIHEGTV